MELNPVPLSRHHHHPQHPSIKMRRNPFYRSSSLLSPAAANFRSFFTYSSSTRGPCPFFSLSFSVTTITTRSFCAAAVSTPTTTTISSPNSAITIHHHHQPPEEEEEPSIPPLPLLLKTKTKTKTNNTTTKKKCVMTKESVADMKQKWLSSLNNPPTHIHVPSHDDWVLGIDPDVSGALALLKPPLHDSSPHPQVFDSPHLKILIGNRIRRRLDTKAITELLQSFDAPNGTVAYLEQSLPYPGDGKQGWWSGGFNYGIWIGVLVALGFSVVPVPSLLWKNQFKLSGNGSSKDDSREVARTLFPSISSQLRRKKDHGRAEALLIAAYGKGLKMGSYSSLVAEDVMPLSLEC